VGAALGAARQAPKLPFHDAQTPSATTSATPTAEAASAQPAVSETALSVARSPIQRSWVRGCSLRAVHLGFNGIGPKGVKALVDGVLSQQHHHRNFVRSSPPRSQPGAFVGVGAGLKGVEGGGAGASGSERVEGGASRSGQGVGGEGVSRVVVGSSTGMRGLATLDLSGNPIETGKQKVDAKAKASLADSLGKVSGPRLLPISLTPLAV
jgi:hypothetical protein